MYMYTYTASVNQLLAAECTVHTESYSSSFLFICNLAISYYTSSTTVIVGMITHSCTCVYFNKVKMLALCQIVYIYWNKGQK